MRLRTLADGTPRVEIDLECSIESAAQLFNAPGVTVALARLHTQQIASAAEPKHPYGQQAKALKQSSFFRSPDVWKAIGSDDEFLDFVRNRTCCAKETMGAAKCNGDIVAAHVRRIADGAGTGIKPEYSAVALCDRHHRLQHEQGESAIGGKDYLDRERLQHVEQWAWDSLKGQLGHDSMGDIPPENIAAWAAEHSLSQYLPAAYR